MSHDNDDDRKRVAWVAPEPMRDDAHTEAAADELERRIVLDRMLGLWRAAVGSVTGAEQARQEREHDEPRKPLGTWGRRQAAGNAN